VGEVHRGKLDRGSPDAAEADERSQGVGGVEADPAVLIKRILLLRSSRRPSEGEADGGEDAVEGHGRQAWVVEVVEQPEPFAQQEVTTESAVLGLNSQSVAS
jgi:hypothetical protein